MHVTVRMYLGAHQFYIYLTFNAVQLHPEDVQANLGLSHGMSCLEDLKAGRQLVKRLTALKILTGNMAGGVPGLRTHTWCECE